MHIIEKSTPKELIWAEKLVALMDDQFRIPILNIRFGLDPIIGLVPFAGDIVSFCISALIIVALVRDGLPTKLIFTMVANIVLDLLIGGIPVIGDAWDFFYKSNRKNLNLAKKHFEAAT